MSQKNSSLRSSCCYLCTPLYIIFCGQPWSRQYSLVFCYILLQLPVIKCHNVWPSHCVCYVLLAPMDRTVLFHTQMHFVVVNKFTNPTHTLWNVSRVHPCSYAFSTPLHEPLWLHVFRVVRQHHVLQCCTSYCNGIICDVQGICTLLLSCFQSRGDGTVVFIV